MSIIPDSGIFHMINQWECDQWINTYNEQLSNKGIKNETSRNDSNLTRFISCEQLNKHFIGIRVYIR